MIKLALRRSRRGTVALVLAAACGLLAMTPWGRELFDRALASYQLHCLLASEGEDATLCAAALAAHGPTALPQLAEALTAPRAVVAQAAQHALQREIATWDSLPPGEANFRLRVLARELAARVNRLSPSARQLATRQATRLLSQNESQSGDSDVLQDCESILSQIDVAQTRREEQSHAALRLADDAVLTRVDPAGSAAEATDDGLTERSLALPGGSLPVLARTTSPLEASEIETQMPEERGAGSPVDAQEAIRAESSAMTPLRIAVGSEPGQKDGVASAQPTLQVLPAAGVMRASSVQVDGAPARIKQAGFSSQSPSRVALPGDAEDGVTLTSMYRLHDDDSQVVATAEAELARRGFGERELELARRLTDDDPHVRRQLAELLPGLSGIDAKLWLTWLSRDSKADVRLAALTVMATTGHPQMLAQVAKVAGEDDDPRIQKLGERLSQPTASKRRTP